MGIPVKLIIAGGRDFTNEYLMRDRLQALEDMGKFSTGVELVCGMARGADMTGHRIFQSAGLPINKFPADWERFGKGAGYVCNVQMGHFADMALIFWDTKSKGTQHMISVMETLGKPAFVVNY